MHYGHFVVITFVVGSRCAREMGPPYFGDPQPYIAIAVWGPGVMGKWGPPKMGTPGPHFPGNMGTRCHGKMGTP